LENPRCKVFLLIVMGYTQDFCLHRYDLAVRFAAFGMMS